MSVCVYPLSDQIIVLLFVEVGKGKFTLEEATKTQSESRGIAILFLISNFRRVLNIVCFLLGDSPASGV
jgi:hypothetical protein